MTSQEQCSASFFDINLPAEVIALVFVFTMMAIGPPLARAQTLTVLHSFSGEGDGAFPESGLTMDRAGRLYGTTYRGQFTPGLVFRIVDMRSNWVLNPLHNFTYSNGGYPASQMIFGPDGNLYGTTYAAGQGSCYLGDGCGVVFRMQPSASACVSVSCPWTETVLHTFTGASDGGNPIGDIVFDAAGNLYGATQYGGANICEGVGCGVVYKLTPSSNGWTETVIHDFAGGSDGFMPSGGVMSDTAGNLYGVTADGGTVNDGVVYELTPSMDGWTETVLYTFQGTNQGAHPLGTLVADPAGNLYGSTGGDYTYGSRVFELAQPGTWTYQILWNFPGWTTPAAGLTLDNSGNVYGAIQDAGDALFELTHSNGNWSLVTLHSFSQSEGVGLNGGLVFDSSGNLYGTAQSGGDLNCEVGYGEGCGTVWEFTP